MCYVHYSQATIDKQSEAVDLSLAGLQKAFLTLTGMEVYNYIIYLFFIATYLVRHQKSRLAQLVDKRSNLVLCK